MKSIELPLPGVVKSTIWYVLPKNKSTGELKAAERLGRAWKTAVVVDGR